MGRDDSELERPGGVVPDTSGVRSLRPDLDWWLLVGDLLVERKLEISEIIFVACAPADLDLVSDFFI